MIRDHLSTWAARSAAETREAFVAAHPGPFLVWEPGPWLPRGAGDTARPPPGTSFVSLAQMAEKAIVIPLAPEKTRLVLGRAPECELPINDGSLSRKHLALVLGPGQPTVEELHSSNGSSLDGRRLEPGQPQPLVSGAQLQAGSVYLTFLDAAGLFDRLRAR